MAVNDRLEHLKKTSLLQSEDSDTPRSRTQERFSDSEMAQIKKAFAKRFKEAFNHASNAEIARRLGVQDMTVKPYADGDRLPTGEMLLWISLKSGVSIDWLLTGKGTRRPETNNIFTEVEEAKINYMASESGRSFNEMVQVLTVAMIEAYEKI